LACPGRHPDPLQLSLQRLLSGRGLLFLVCQPLLLLLQPGGVVPLPGDPGALIQLQNPAGHVVEEIPIVGHRHHRALELGQVSLQPPHALCVEVVGGLVEEKHVGLLEEQATKRDSAFLAS